MSNVARGCLLVTAHPDDECMFFTPAIRAAIHAGERVHLLCLSSGNHDGLGAMRRRELERSCAVLGITSVTVIEDKDLQDGPEHRWPAVSIQKHVERELVRRDVHRVLTFDPKGASGHVNHCAIGRALRYATARCHDGHDERVADRGPHVEQLVTLPLWIKYLGPLGCLLARWFLVRSATRIAVISRRDSWDVGARAMKQHASQLVWFRWLFLVFSVYMQVNIIRRSDNRNKR